MTAGPPPGGHYADALIMTHPFRTRPDKIDGLVCGRCGHPVWAHCINETCAECDVRDSSNACGAFTLAGFTAVSSGPYEEHAFGQ